MAYKSSKKDKQKPKWIKEFRWKWAKDGELVKLLGVPFGLNLDTKEVDFFFLENYEKNLHIMALSICVLLISS